MNNFFFNTDTRQNNRQLEVNKIYLADNYIWQPNRLSQVATYRRHDVAWAHCQIHVPKRTVHHICTFNSFPMSQLQAALCLTWCSLTCHKEHSHQLNILQLTVLELTTVVYFLAEKVALNNPVVDWGTPLHLD